MKIGQYIYSQNQDAQADMSSNENSDKSEDKVVDAEFEDVDNKK